MAISAVAVAGTLAMGVAVVGETAVHAAEARSAADSAALAGAANGHEAAIEVAEINGARVLSVETNASITRVVVVRGRVQAEAAAERLVVPIP